MLKLRIFAITSTTVGYLLLGSSHLPSLEAIPATPSSGTAGSTSGAGTSGSSIFAPSRGTAGSTSGAGTTGSSILGGLIQIGEIVITAPIQTSLNNVGSQIIASLIQAGGVDSLIASLLTTSVSDLSVNSAIAILSSTNIQGITTSTPTTLSNGVLLYTTISGNNSVTISVSGNINGSSVNISTNGSANPQRAIAAAAAVLASGGTPAQAQLAASLVGTNTSVNSALVIQLIHSLPGLFSNSQASLPMTNLRSSLDNLTNLNPRIEEKSPREKSFESTLPTLISQGKGVTVNAEKLSQAIRAYNNLIDTSSPEALQALSKNKEFTTIGDSLRKLRVSLDTYALNR